MVQPLRHCRKSRLTVGLLAFAAACLLLASAAASARATIVLNEDFDGGCLNVPNCVIDPGDANTEPTITLAGRYNWPQDPNQWAWLMFYADGVGTKKPTFKIKTNIIEGTLYPETPARLVYSYDQLTWYFFDNGDNDGNFYTFSSNSRFTSNRVYVALGLPYPTWRTAQFIASIKSNPYVRPTPTGDANFIIGHTPGTGGRDPNGNLYVDANGNPYRDDMGRIVPSLPVYGFQITDFSVAGPKTRIVIQSGNHGAEHWAHYALEGMILTLLDGNDPNMAALRKKVVFFIYPDVNPEGNFCGYWRSTPVNPWDDHNRVWASDSNWIVVYPAKNPEVAIIEAAQRADTGGFAEYFFDIHGQWERHNYPDYLDYASLGSRFQQYYSMRDPISSSRAPLGRLELRHGLCRVHLRQRRPFRQGKFVPGNRDDSQPDARG